MAQQEEGWPLGLQPLNVRVGLVRNRDINGSLSFNTLLTPSPISSSHSSSDLDTESTGSFFHDKSITLGSLIGISNILELSRRSTRGGITEPVRNKKNYKTKTWFLSLCSRLSTDAVSINNAPSLGHFLEAERRAATTCRRNPVSPTGAYGPDDFSHVLDPNSLFVEGHIAPPQPNFDRESLSHGIADEPSLLFSCLCGNPTH
ncbi:hypothetical protein BUALT_Bualt09G0110800 [Buddleja alternifolia]|uniref:Uncharacterized protein n=1 Tax=Buddleja alternifolia TaxID=168488 RepID=A0AAV6X8B6_9LAMI|nr:hypothetical protein BUALT_Bualt09G0110800 [Buddleja alternifolia]